MIRSFLTRLVALVMPGLAFAQGALPSVSVHEAEQRLNAGKSVLVDIRTPEEWAETGVPKGAIRLDMTAPTFVASLEAVRTQNPGKEIDLICRSSSRSSYVQKELARRGWSNLVNVRGGMAGGFSDKGWLPSKLPVEKK